MADKNKPQEDDGLDAYELAEEKPVSKPSAGINPTLFLDDAAAKPPKAPDGKPTAPSPASTRQPDSSPAAHPKLVDPLELARKREEGRRKLAEQQAMENARRAKVKLVALGVIAVVAAGLWVWLRTRP